MKESWRLNIATMLKFLFGSVIVFLVLVVGQDTVVSLRRLSDNRGVQTVAEASRTIFTAMQAIRLERGSTRRLLLQPAGSDPATMAKLPGWRLPSAHLAETVASVCETVACAPGLGAAELRATISRLEAVRGEVDSALKVEPLQRRKGLVDEVMSTGGTAVDLLARSSKALLDPMRALDPVLSEMISTKEAAVAAREAATPLRLLFDSTFAKKEVSSEDRTQMAHARGQFDAAWRILVDASQRPGTPAPLRAAIATAERSYVAEYLKARETVLTAVAARQEPSVRVEDLNELGPVDIHRVAKTVATRLMAAA